MIKFIAISKKNVYKSKWGTEVMGGKLFSVNDGVEDESRFQFKKNGGYKMYQSIVW